MERVIAALIATLLVTEAYASYPDTIGRIRSPKGTTLNGVVYCGDSPVAGVAVSDGYEVTYTDDRGIYSLNSEKKLGLVFISTPSGYQPHARGIRPQFWAGTTMAPGKRERHDFELESIDDNRFSVIVCTDTHLINDDRRKDIGHFRRLFIPSVRRTCSSLKEVPVFTICLGDITWDRFWYQNEFDLTDVYPLLEGDYYPTPFYGVIGNHDHDPSVPHGPDTDMLASRPYRSIFGPTYYSMTRGGVHFVILDDIVYKNQTKEGQIIQKNVAGSRNYDTHVTKEQVDWLRKDLANVSSSTPIVVCMHAPMMRYGHDGNVIEAQTKGHFDELYAILDRYDRVMVWSGHQHKNNCFQVRGSGRMTEYTVAATAGELWKTLMYTPYNFCDDGTDAGYYQFDFTDGMYRSTYHSLQDDGCPVRLYDMNGVGRFYSEWKNREQLEHAVEILPAQRDYSSPQYRNYVYINCFLAEKGTVIAATEEGRSLDVEQVTDPDPMSSVVLISRSVKSKSSDRNANGLSQVHHMYRVRATRDDTPVTVTVRTAGGGTFTRTIVRPAEFNPFR